MTLQSCSFAIGQSYFETEVAADFLLPERHERHGQGSLRWESQCLRQSGMSSPTPQLGGQSAEMHRARRVVAVARLAQTLNRRQRKDRPQPGVRR